LKYPSFGIAIAAGFFQSAVGGSIFVGSLELAAACATFIWSAGGLPVPPESDADAAAKAVSDVGKTAKVTAVAVVATAAVPKNALRVLSPN